MSILDSVVGRVGWLANRWPWLASKVNPFAINKQVNACRNRPHPWSTAHDYVSWTSLTDTTWHGRHLAPVAEARTTPSSEDLIGLFDRSGRDQVMSDKSTILFPAFAQYLTDGFLRTRMPNTSKGEKDDVRRRTTSNHQIDMCPLYGNNAEQTRVLRLCSEERGRRGRLKSQEINGEEWAPYLYLANGEMHPDFMTKPAPGEESKPILDEPVSIDKVRPGYKERLFAFGGDRANTMPHVAMLNTLFLREHNRLAGEIEAANPDWKDEQVFQTARNTVIVVFIKIVVEEYINHIAGEVYKLQAIPDVAWRAPWNRPNWMTTEFSLLYRWHSLVPDAVQWNGKPYEIKDLVLNTEPLLNVGLAGAFVSLSAQPAARLGAFNTADFLVPIEKAAIDQGRLVRLPPYADYREYMGKTRPKAFEDISKDDRVVAFLRKMYPSPADVEFYIGLFAEDPGRNGPLPSLMQAMVAVDAFSQALTNPLLSEHVFNEKVRTSTFSAPGRATIEGKNTLEALVRRNTPKGAVDGRITMTQPGWRRKR